MYAKSVEQVKQYPQSVAPMPGKIAYSADGYANAGGRHARARGSWQTSRGGLQQFLVAQLLEAREHEKQRIASDLHDVLGQSLTMIKLSVHESMMLLAANEAGGATALLQRLTRMVGNAIGELHDVAMNLRPPMLDDLGVLATLSWFFREFETACQGIKVEKQFSIREDSIPASLRVTIFRIIQEATNNIVKHANADSIRVGLKKSGDTLYLSIEDDGDGFDQARHGMGIGLLSMKERAEISGGRYTMKSAVGQGTRITVSWRLDKLRMANKNKDTGALDWQQPECCRQSDSQLARSFY